MTLLLLGQIDTQKVAHQILQAVPVGIGAHQPGGDLGAIDRLGIHPEMAAQHAKVEAGEMKQLGHFRIGEQLL